MRYKSLIVLALFNTFHNSKSTNGEITLEDAVSFAEYRINQLKKKLESSESKEKYRQRIEYYQHASNILGKNHPVIVCNYQEDTGCPKLDVKCTKIRFSRTESGRNILLVTKDDKEQPMINNDVHTIRIKPNGSIEINPSDSIKKENSAKLASVDELSVKTMEFFKKWHDKAEEKLSKKQTTLVKKWNTRAKYQCYNHYLTNLKLEPLTIQYPEKSGNGFQEFKLMRTNSGRDIVTAQHKTPLTSEHGDITSVQIDLKGEITINKQIPENSRLQSSYGRDDMFLTSIGRKLSADHYDKIQK